jgi:radical SAM protein with 4Fe4S-binding SPASM domain
MTRSASRRIHEPGPRQFVNELLGERAFERGDARSLHRPLELHMQLTSGCNLDCYMCHEHLRPEGTRHGKGMRMLEPAALERIEREVMPYASRLHLGVGGEPMLAPYFLELVERAHAQNQRIHLTTNGTRIATERVAEVLARCVHDIEISADGATAATYERIRGGASFARLLGGIELLNRHRSFRDLEDRPRLTLCMVLMRSNVHELPLMVELAARLSVDGVAAWPVIPVTAEGRADALDLAAARPYVTLARERASQLGIELDLPFDHKTPDAQEESENRTTALRRLAKFETSASTQRPRRHACHMPTLAVYVLWDGRVYPCANPEAHQGDALGNLALQGFEEIWNGRPFRNLRAGLASGDAPEVCRRCPILHRSAGPVEGASSDLVRWFGERDLDPTSAGTLGSEPVEVAVASGLADQVQRRHFKLLSYSHQLERELHQLDSDNERLKHERDAARLHLDALVEERRHLKAHADVLDRERKELLGCARRLEDEVTRLGDEGQRSRHAVDAARLESQALLADRQQLRIHAELLDRERKALARHAVTLEAERQALLEYSRHLEDEVRRLGDDGQRSRHAVDAARLESQALSTDRRQLGMHAGLLDRERKELLGYARRLEDEVRRLGAEDQRSRHAVDAARLESQALLADREQLRIHADLLDRERKNLARHAATLEAERQALLAYSRRLEDEVRRLGDDGQRLRHAVDAARLESRALSTDRRQLGMHADLLDRERKSLTLHAATLEAEREQLVGHIANLERIFRRTHARSVHAVLSTIKDFVLRPRPRAPFAYLPPWVADGTRRAGEPPGRLDA